MEEVDPAFVALCRPRNRYERAACRWLFDAWRGRGQPACGPHLDPVWRHKLRTDFLQRFWELYLVAAVLEAGLEPAARKHDAGPDIILRIADAIVGVEAVCPSRGAEGSTMRVPELPVGTGIASLHPMEEVEARIVKALRSKGQQIIRWQQHDDARCDSYIIAINTRGATGHRGDTVPPSVLRAAFGMGPIAVDVNREDLSFSDPYVTHEQRNAKHPGVPKGLITPETAPWRRVTGLVYADVDAFNHPGLHGRPVRSALVWVPNPYADLAIAAPAIAMHQHELHRERDTAWSMDVHPRPLGHNAGAGDDDGH